MTDQPTYTRVPNDLIAAMPKLGNAELRVALAIARKTVGYQKECDRISVSQIVDMTGLTSRNTQQAITSLLKKGVIERTPAGKQAYCYSLKTMSLGDTDQNHIPSDTISLRDTEPYPVGIQLNGSPYPLGTTQKKDLKEKKERDGSRIARSPPPKQTNLDSFNEAVVIFKELSGKKHITPALTTLIVTRVSDMDRWRATINGWVGCGYNVMGVKDMLDWYDHPEKMAARLDRSNRNAKPLRPNLNGHSERKPQVEADLDKPL